MFSCAQHLTKLGGLAVGRKLKAEERAHDAKPFCGGALDDNDRPIDDKNSTVKMSNFVLFGRKWEKTALTYRITKYPSRGGLLRNGQVDQLTRQAFGKQNKYGSVQLLHN